MAETKITSNEVEAQEAWIAPTLLNSWINYGSAYDTVGYMKDSLGFVHIKGFIKSGTATPGTVIFNLPAGYRPGGWTYFATPGSSASVVGAIEVKSTGAVAYVSGGNTYIGFGHIMFKAEN